MHYIIINFRDKSPHFSSPLLKEDMKTICNAELHIYTKEMEGCAFAPSTDQCSLHIYTKEMEGCAFAPSTDQCS